MKLFSWLRGKIAARRSNTSGLSRRQFLGAAAVAVVAPQLPAAPSLHSNLVTAGSDLSLGSLNAYKYSQRIIVMKSRQVGMSTLATKLGRAARDQQNRIIAEAFGIRPVPPPNTRISVV